MIRLIKQRDGMTAIDVAIFVVVLAIVCVVALPRYSRFVKTAEARTYINQITEASQAALMEFDDKTNRCEAGELPSDEELLAKLKEHLGGAIPENPFTKSNEITVQHAKALAPCKNLDTTGGWLWNLVPRGQGGETMVSMVWLNSDTVNISKGQGESCIQP